MSILVSFQVPRAEIFATLQPRSGLPKVGAGRGGVAGAWGDVAARSLTRALRLDKSRDWPAVSGRVARTRATGRSVSASRSSACFSGDTWAPPRPPPKKKGQIKKKKNKKKINGSASTARPSIRLSLHRHSRYGKTRSTRCTQVKNELESCLFFVVNSGTSRFHF